MIVGSLYEALMVVIVTAPNLREQFLASLKRHPRMSFQADSEQSRRGLGRHLLPVRYR